MESLIVIVCLVTLFVAKTYAYGGCGCSTTCQPPCFPDHTFVDYGFGPQCACYCNCYNPPSSGQSPPAVPQQPPAVPQQPPAQQQDPQQPAATATCQCPMPPPCECPCAENTWQCSNLQGRVLNCIKNISAIYKCYVQVMPMVFGFGTGSDGAGFDENCCALLKNLVGCQAELTVLIPKSLTKYADICLYGA